MQADYTPGQRWLSDAEPELGLGLISAVEHRNLHVYFPASNTERIYARDHAPLRRFRFHAGDNVQDQQDKSFRITDCVEADGLLVYRVLDTEGHAHDLPESRISATVSLQQPLSRLLAAQTDSKEWFELRMQCLQNLHFLESSPALPLCSARTALLPHQLYIADEVARRYAPRVLLADEVGLGKTIEAGLILQARLASGLDSRVLILVPEALLHQWLVELLRRFNLNFSVFDAERCRNLQAEGHGNPFLNEQLILCHNTLFSSGENAAELLQQAMAAGWDLLIVDEAHHMLVLDMQSNPAADSAAGGSPARNQHDIYPQVKALAAAVPGLILLTATPDQAGQLSHFALLQLLDPDRFHDFAAFQEEQLHYRELADRLSELEQEPGEHSATIRELLDRHGTGRIVFRNSRSNIKGFPERCPLPVPLPCPQLYTQVPGSLQPEAACPAGQWLQEDPRVAWLLTLLNANKGEKILLICALRSTAIALEKHLRLQHGIRSSVFHEDMSIIERDRAAAYFAEADGGARILICSEIGSEGRNFQFSSHLVLFDLPLNPDLLEQRIGRLDRIGQTRSVHIHIPWLQGTAQETLYRWYEEGLDAFRHSNPAAAAIYAGVRDELIASLACNGSPAGLDQHPAAIEPLLQRTQALNVQLQAEFAAGRDRLLELNSFNPSRSAELLQTIHELEARHSPADWLEAAFAAFGLDSEVSGDGRWSVNPNDDMLVPDFPGIPPEGLSFTCRRELALHREDLPFVSWYHPLVTASMDLVLQGDYGKCSLALLDSSRLPANSRQQVRRGSLLLESVYRVNVQAARELQVSRFLPCTLIRSLFSEKRQLDGELPADILSTALQNLDKQHLQTILQEKKDSILRLNQAARQHAEQQLPAIIANSSRQMLATLDDEIRRLQALRKLNPNIRDEETGFLQQQKAALQSLLPQAGLHQEGLRLILVM